MPDSIKTKNEEIKKLDSECRALRLKQAGLQEENNKIFNSTIRLKERAAILRNEVKAIEEEKAAICASLAKIRESKEKELSLIAEADAKVGDREKAVKDAEDLVSNTNTILNDRQNELGRREAALKEKFNAIALDRASLDQLREHLKEKERALEKEAERISSEKETIEEKDTEYKKAAKEAEEIKNAGEEILKDAREKAAIAESKFNIANRTVEELAKERGIIEAEKVNIAADQKKNSEESARLKNEKKAIAQGYIDLQAKEMEVEIKRLRVEKIIHDKGIEKEYEELKKELEK